MQAGNAHYHSASELPSTVPVFPLPGALLLPGGQMPLNIFEPRYLQMVDDAMRGDRIIAMCQPRFDVYDSGNNDAPLCDVGCLGRITSLGETGDGRYVLTLQGICRFRVVQELAVTTPYRQISFKPFVADLEDDKEDEEEVDREALLTAFRAYLDANGMEADWESVSRASNETLVNALSMMSPYGPAEKQALLEAPDLKTRAETLIAITEINLARDDDENGGTVLQ